MAPRVLTKYRLHRAQAYIRGCSQRRGRRPAVFEVLRLRRIKFQPAFREHKISEGPPDLAPLIAHVRLDIGSVPLELRCINECRVDCEALATRSITRGPRISMTNSDPFAYATAAKPVEDM
jgi:hypothetical protein